MKRDSKELQDAIDVMTAYRDGAEIELKLIDGAWMVKNNPRFDSSFANYRIKKELREFVVFPYVNADSQNVPFGAVEMPGDDVWSGAIKVREVIE